jgi:S-adenosylmethionine:tRNA ribosyltransferase-isomerase
MHPKDLSIAGFSYELPPERIALHPLSERDASRLLVSRNGQITETIYRDIAREIPGY